ncbi:hypothetical protein DICPUDRAFT_74671 [Dictyostelium purpureum]|uniref:EGF-like domain-containing protein n=1 Tax=Dictyostelium purpureum TaxID=5786 RepID=F0Z8F1_DICPU|nr:uncharacterized protein DICPUDRAFT_74671 [Dictyostelium purpureum]EGC39828.1 hypothetical protein DICPUDRAFT_74671 [Dictyostelium purpureum]|eukprot:XP_003283695.1 hypothetical protein DICPUDRAFT_74671 [Dictyostelium purpureum]
MNLNVFLLFIFLFLVNNSFVYSSQDEDCLKVLLTKLFNIKDVKLCDNFIDTSYYRGSCYRDTNTLQSLTLNGDSQNPNSNLFMPSLVYSDLSCFENLDILILEFMAIKKDAFGANDQKNVANSIYLTSCFFNDGRIVSENSFLPKGINSLTIYLNSFSNFNELGFRSIKNLKNIYIDYVLNLDSELNTYPKYINDLQGIESNFENFYIVSNEVPNFTDLKVSYFYLTIVGDLYLPSIHNFGSLNQIENFTFSYNGEIEFPRQLLSNNKISYIYLYCDLKTPTEYIIIPNTVYSFRFLSRNSKFNINGKLPFIFPDNMTYLNLHGLGLVEFPILPKKIQRLYISGNNFSLNSPKTLPDLSTYEGLNEVSFYETGFCGPIPESYCSFKTSLTYNNLNGTLPMCKTCYLDITVEEFKYNPNLRFGVCDESSIIPNLDISFEKEITLYGENLGWLVPFVFNYPNIFSMVKGNSMFKAKWDENYGQIPDSLVIMLPPRNFTFNTKNVLPSLNNITKSNIQFTFEGSNFSYNKKDFEIKIANEICLISYINFNKIICNFPNQKVLPAKNDAPATIKNTRSGEFISFAINTLEDKTTVAKECPNQCLEGICSINTGACICNPGYSGEICSPIPCKSDCGTPEGRGECDDKVGICVCTLKWKGESCDIPNQFLTSASSTLSSGGLVDLFGWFGLPNEGLAITIGSLNCQKHYFNTTFANCTIGAGSGTKSIKIIQNNQKWIGENIFHYIETTYRCPKDCSLNGVANGECNNSSGQCKCFSDWGGYDCNSKSTTGGSTSSSTGSSTPSLEIPKSNTTIINGISSISNQQTKYEISIFSLIEYDVTNKIVFTHNLTNKWIGIGDTGKDIHKFKQNISETCIITYIIEDIKESRDYEFAGLQLSLEKDSIKITITIDNYPFKSTLNKLQLRLESLVGDDGTNIANNECNKKETSIDKDLIDSNQLLNYITISRNEKVLNGRFINRVLSDHRQSFVTTSLISNSTTTSNKESFIIGLNLPYFTESLTIDPDFSVLVSPSFKKCKSIDNANWVLPVAIVVPLVAVVAFIIMSAIIYKKNRTMVLLVKNKFKLRSL